MSCKDCEPLINGQPDELQEGFSAYQNGDYTRAFNLLLPYAEKGRAMAQCCVGGMYSLGLGTPLNGQQAIKWYLRAGQQGCGLSYNNLATIYMGTMPDVLADVDQAKEYRHKAAENGFDMISRLQSED